MHAIPTSYGGVNFRSRLEARWAAFFDLLGWSWEYEPIDLAGYIPDFVVGDRTLVEVKPALTHDELLDCVSKIEQSGWHGSVILCGAVGQAVLGDVGNSRVFFEDGRELWSGKLWREAGNRVQWKRPA